MDKQDRYLLLTCAFLGALFVAIFMGCSTDGFEDIKVKRNINIGCPNYYILRADGAESCEKWVAENLAEEILIERRMNDAKNFCRKYGAYEGPYLAASMSCMSKPVKFCKAKFPFDLPSYKKCATEASML